MPVSRELFLFVVFGLLLFSPLSLRIPTNVSAQELTPPIGEYCLGYWTIHIAGVKSGSIGYITYGEPAFYQWRVGLEDSTISSIEVYTGTSAEGSSSRIVPDKVEDVLVDGQTLKNITGILGEDSNLLVGSHWIRIKVCDEGATKCCEKTQPFSVAGPSSINGETIVPKTGIFDEVNNKVLLGGIFLLLGGLISMTPSAFYYDIKGIKIKNGLTRRNSRMRNFEKKFQGIKK